MFMIVIVLIASAMMFTNLPQEEARLLPLFDLIHEKEPRNPAHGVSRKRPGHDSSSQLQVLLITIANSGFRAISLFKLP